MDRKNKKISTFLQNTQENQLQNTLLALQDMENLLMQKKICDNFEYD